MKHSLKIHEQKCKLVANSELPSEETGTIEMNATKSIKETVVDRRSEYLSCSKCGLKFVYDFVLELHVELYHHPSEKNDEAST